MDTDSTFRNKPAKGRGALSNPEGRFESRAREAYDDGWTRDEEIAQLKTTVHHEHCRTIIAHNDSPDIPFDQSINPYRGCEHGCIYCYARPSHGYLGLSAGLDFETQLFAKTNAVERLRVELSRPGYTCRPLALGSNTDPYQPIERRYRLMRGILEVLSECNHPLTIVTKSALIERDLDLLGSMAHRNLVRAFVSVTTLDRALARRLEPRTTAPQRRLETIQRLSAAGIPVGVMVAPVIAGLTDQHMEEILEAARTAGAESSGYVLLRLPHEVKHLFREWLTTHAPLKASHIMSLVRATRGGQDNDPRFGTRLRGFGLIADLIAERFTITCRRLGYSGADQPLTCDSFVALTPGRQLRLI